MSRSKTANRASERVYTSARDRADKQSVGFSAPYLKVPSGITLFKPKAGTFLLDVLPYTAGAGNPWAEEGNLHWERTYYVHRGIGANNDAFLCPRMTVKARCPICEHRLHLMKEASGDEDKEQLVKDLAPKQRQLFNVINLKDPEAKVQLWDISYHLFGKVLDARLRNSDDDDEWGRFFFLEDGLTLKVGFAEKTYAGKGYFETETIDFKKRSEQYDEEILEKVVNLDDILVLAKYEDLKATFLQVVEDDEDAPPVKKKSKPVVDDDDEDEEEAVPVVKKKSKPVVDDDDEDEEDEDEEEEAVPVVKKKSKPVVDDDDEDEEEAVPVVKKKSKPVVDEDDEDEEEEEAVPVVKKKSGGDQFAKAEGDGWDDFDEDKEPAPKKKSSR